VHYLPSRRIHVLLLIVCLSALAQGTAHADTDIFSTHIAPLLEARCVECHQPNILKGDFSLTSQADLLASGKITPGDPAASRLLEVVQPGPNGEAPEMPKKGAPLTAEEVERIRQWIADSAPWPEGVVLKEPSKADTSWWSLQTLAEVAPPEVPDAPEAWQGNPVDRFLFAKLADKSIAPAHEADRRTLIRRLYFDLLGLPPTIQAIESFAADTRPDAYARLVDELLASPHYGERWARHWLDIAHYADTHGFERDRPRDNAWRYRDYVIRAFNENKPYDQFLREQIAGDVLQPDSREAVIATGFLAAGPWDLVGQDETGNAALKRLARADDLDDMVATTITATMALTVNCARCHDHKLDPIPQKDYFRLTAVFAGTTRGDRTVAPAWDAAQARLAAIQRELDSLQAKPIDLVDLIAGGDGYGTGRPYPAGISTQTGALLDGMVAGVETTPNVYVPVPDLAAVDGVFVPDGAPGQPITITSTGLQVDDLPDTSGATWDYVLNGKVSSQATTVIDGVDYGVAPNTLLGFHANKGITFDLDAIRATGRGDQFRFCSIAGYGGNQEATRADIFVYVDGALRAVRRGFGTKDGAIPIEFDIGPRERFLTLVATDGGDGIGFDQVFFGNPQLVIRDGAAHLTPEQQATQAKLHEERDRLRKSYPPDEKPDQVYATLARDLPETRIHLRGSPESPGDAVTPGALSCLSMLVADLGDDTLSEGERRLRLAEWITHPDNPLTPRVWVNRLWHYHFGKGIVDTPSDFGFGGGRPSHPELLDWLAARLQAGGWSTKAMHRLIVTSQAYRQESRLGGDTPAGFADPREVDADNRLLWRMNPRRLPAEALRDAILATAGTLNPAAFGPGYRDFTMEEDYAPKYTYITADTPDLWRRSIYRFVVRSSPEPFMTTLDCPNPAVLTPARMTTTTALQSLSLLNNEFMLKQAGYFAERVKREAGADIADQVRYAFSLAFGRDPGAEEATAAIELVEAQGLAAFCRVLFNANEFVHID
jgi:hypothetical protein